ncbi:hypothetical protein [Cecembia sp.]|uniref:hypothetical protein n=1 Tax=Cecembia sp. TaxID=1898110 RepID=UPI0025BE2955|nr:hypothetical protein [Cecembia sp.]
MRKGILKIAIIGGFISLGMMNCSPANENNRPKKEPIKVDAIVIKTASVRKTVEIDSLIDYFSYASIIEVRFLKNNQTLNYLKKKVKPMNDSIQFKYNKELYELNKRNLEIKSMVQGHVNQDPTQWKIFKKSMNDEMAKLEKSISILSEK